jgi:hypothetical protein
MPSSKLALVLLFGAALAPAAARGDGPAPAPAPAVPHEADAVKFMHELQDTIAKQTDDQALASIKQLVAFWKDATDKDSTTAPMPGLVAWYARRKIPAVSAAGIGGLADIGKGEGTRNLLQILDTFLDRDGATATTTAQTFAALKKVADPDPAVVKTLLKYLFYKDDSVIAKAADTLGGYATAPGDLRKELFEELLRNFEGLAAEARKAANKSAANKWGIVGGSVDGALGALAHQSFTDPAAARKWLNEHHRDPAAWS